MLRRISRDQVAIGMFIHGFDGPWVRHPFWLPRFRLESQSDLMRILQSGLETLVIDESLGLACPDAGCGILHEAPSVPTPSPGRPPVLRIVARPAERTCSFAQERARATQVIRHASEEMKRLFADVRMGHAIRPDDVGLLVDEISASLVRNDVALIRLTRMKSRDEYTYLHSVAVSALLVSFGRALGLSPGMVYDLGLAGLLHDIGKMVVPGRILNKPESLTAEEFAIVRTHPEQGYRLLGDMPDMPMVVLDVCRHHHERMDGNGYPLRLTGDALSLPARISAICDVYDALTSDRVYKAAWSPQEAITRMHAWTGHFDPELLFRFMKMVQVFPVGMLVRLRSNRLGVILPNGRRSSRVLARAFYATRDRCGIAFADVTIGEELNHDQILGEEDPAAWGLQDWPEMAAEIVEGRQPKALRAA